MRFQSSSCAGCLRDLHRAHIGEIERGDPEPFRFLFGDRLAVDVPLEHDVKAFAQLRAAPLFEAEPPRVSALHTVPTPADFINPVHDASAAQR